MTEAIQARGKSPGTREDVAALAERGRRGSIYEQRPSGTSAVGDRAYTRARTEFAAPVGPLDNPLLTARGVAMIKTGLQHIETLRDGRHVYIDGGLAGDVTVHPSFRRTVQSVGMLYDFQAQPENRALMTFETPDGGPRANRIWQLPQSYADLVERRRALEAWTELHYGFLGRAPDHVASCISGMYMGIEAFQAYDGVRAGALADYYRFARDNELYLTYAIINPQADRSKGASEQQDRFLTAGVVDQDGEGITVRGAKMLATGGVMANEALVTCIQPLGKDEERYAVSFAIPMNAKGLKVLSRKSYEHGASVFDNPLASRFDENDAVLYFDDVKVPWERVFVNQDTAMCQRQFHATPAHVYRTTSRRSV